MMILYVFMHLAPTKRFLLWTKAFTSEGDVQGLFAIGSRIQGVHLDRL